MSLSSEVWRAIRARPDLKAKERGDRLQFRCPRHEDNTPSAWTAGGAWGCFSCGFQESITTLAEELGVPLRGSGKYTLERYADEKGLSVVTLREWGLATVEERGKTVVRIPYHDVDGTELRARFRSATGKWWEGRNRPIYLYGLDRLAEAQAGDTVLIVEGESDCHALWSEGYKAVGVPGATAWRDEWTQHLDGLDVVAWEEPDQGGAQFVQRLAESFPDLRVIRCEDAKDACALRQTRNGTFGRAIDALLRSARKHGAAEPPVVFDVLDERRIERLLEHQLAPIDAVPTPFPSWNRCCRDEGGGEGLARGWHILGAARTGTGKSILALNVAAHAMRHGETVCFVSLEMSQRQVETRLMAIVSGAAVRSIEKGRHFDGQVFSDAARRLVKLPGRFLTNRSPVYAVSDVVGSIRAMHESYGAGFFVVDYIQLAGNPNDPESITEVSHQVRQQAKDLDVVMIGLSQFNRSTSTLRNESPDITGLMGGSALENDADQVVLIDHSKIEESSSGGDRIGWTTNLVLGKNRHGPSGDVPIHFHSRTLRMRELLDDEIPEGLA